MVVGRIKQSIFILASATPGPRKVKIQLPSGELLETDVLYVDERSGPKDKGCLANTYEEARDLVFKKAESDPEELDYLIDKLFRISLEKKGKSSGDETHNQIIKISSVK